MTTRVAIMAAPRAAKVHPIRMVLRSLADHERDIPRDQIGVFCDTPEPPDLSGARSRRTEPPYYVRTRTTAERDALVAGGVRFALLTMIEAIEWCCEAEFGALLEDDVSFAGNPAITLGVRWVRQVESELGPVALSLHDLFGRNEFESFTTPRFACGDGMTLCQARERYWANGSQAHVFSAPSGRAIATRMRVLLAHPPADWPGPHRPHLDNAWVRAARDLAMPYLITRDCIVMHDNLNNSTWAREAGDDDARHYIWKEARRTKRFAVL